LARDGPQHHKKSVLAYKYFLKVLITHPLRVVKVAGKISYFSGFSSLGIISSKLPTLITIPYY